MGTTLPSSGIVPLNTFQWHSLSGYVDSIRQKSENFPSSKSSRKGNKTLFAKIAVRVTFARTFCFSGRTSPINPSLHATKYVFSPLGITAIAGSVSPSCNSNTLSTVLPSANWPSPSIWYVTLYTGSSIRFSKTAYTVRSVLTNRSMRRASASPSLHRTKRNPSFGIASTNCPLPPSATFCLSTPYMNPPPSEPTAYFNVYFAGLSCTFSCDSPLPTSMVPVRIWYPTFDTVYVYIPEDTATQHIPTLSDSKCEPATSTPAPASARPSTSVTVKASATNSAETFTFKSL